MKKIFLILVLNTLSFFSYAQNQSETIVGDWITTDRNAIIRCYKQGNEYFGKVIWYAPFIEAEEGHPINPADNTKFLNTICMKNFVFDKNEWNNGRIIDGYHDKNYAAFAQMNHKNQLEVTGYVVFRWLSQTMTLEKASPATVQQFTQTSLSKR